MLQVSSERSDDEDSSSDGGGDGGGSQEEEEEDSPVHCATEPSTALYAPKPAYDQLEVYSVSDAGTAAAVGGGGATLKQRRSGLSALHQSQILAEHAADEEPVVQAVLTIQPVTSQSATVRSLTSTVAASTPTITVTSSTSEPVNVNVSSAAASNKQDVGSMPWPELPTSPTLHRLQEAGLLNKGPIDKLSTTELEAVFRRVELVLKIDRVTLPDRLEVLRKQRDTAHANYYRELAAVNGHMATIDEECMKGDLATEVEQLKKCLQVLAVAVESVVSAAQAWSGVQHEWSFSRTAEVLQTFTDHCLQQYNDANKQIKHLTTLVNTIPPATPVPGSPGGPRQRATSLNPPQEGRRLSLSPVPRGGADSSSPKVGRSFSSIVTAAAAARRSSLSPNLKPFDEASRMALGNLRVQSIKEEVNSRMTSKSFSSNSGNESSSSACESSARDVSLASRNDKSDVSSGSAAVNNSEHSLDTNSTISGDNSNTVSPSSTVSRLHTYYEEASQLPLSNEQHHHLYESLHEEDDDSDDELLQELLEYERVRAAREAAHRSVMMSRPPPGSQRVAVALYRWASGSSPWPWSRHQTTAGVRWVLCTLLSIMALLLLTALTVSSSTGGGCRRSWLQLFQSCRPLIEVSYIGSPHSTS